MLNILKIEKKIAVIAVLAEGPSIRANERMTGAPIMSDAKKRKK